jgi:hypothetical protein
VAEDERSERPADQRRRKDHGGRHRRNDPKVAKYNGRGSTNIAANFTCVTDEPDFNQTPAKQFGP